MAARATRQVEPERAAEPAGRRRSTGGAALAEGIGTFMLLFFGVGTVLALGGAGGAAEKLTIGLAFGLTILVVAYALGHVSGAHLNPAVTLALTATRRFPAPAALPYIAAQLVGAALGVLAADVLLGDTTPVANSVTRPGTAGVGGALLAEVILGFALVLVVKCTAVDDRSEGAAAGMAIGLVVAVGHLAMIPVSGASFNPARSFGSWVVSGEFPDFWVYIVGPIGGGLLAAFLYEAVLARVQPPDVDE